MPWKNHEKQKLYIKKWFKQNRLWRKEYMHLWRSSLPLEKRRKIHRTSLLKLYGLTEKAYKGMLVKQKSKCRICFRKDIKRLCVDHNHKNGKIRGLICNGCNLRLGWFEKYRKSIKGYLK